MSPKISQVISRLRARADPHDLPRVWDFLRAQTGESQMTLTEFVGPEAAQKYGPEMVDRCLDSLLDALKGGEWAALEVDAKGA